MRLYLVSIFNTRTIDVKDEKQFKGAHTLFEREKPAK